MLFVSDVTAGRVHMKTELSIGARVIDGLAVIAAIATSAICGLATLDWSHHSEFLAPWLVGTSIIFLLWFGFASLRAGARVWRVILISGVTAIGVTIWSHWTLPHHLSAGLPDPWEHYAINALKFIMFSSPVWLIATGVFATVRSKGARVPVIAFTLANLWVTLGYWALAMLGLLMCGDSLSC
jgi:hypothetical protein